MRRGPLCFAFVVLAASACASHPPPPPPTVEAPPAPPAPTATTSATASAAPSAPPPDVPASPEILARLTAAQREELDELGALCPTAVFREGNRLEVGCTACPSNAGPTEDRRPLLAAADATRVTPYARLRGGFTAKGADERLVVMDSCTCAACLEDAYVLRADAGGALRVEAHARVSAQRGCRLVRRAGQVDRALCESQVARMGYSAGSLALYDLAGAHGEPDVDLPPVFSFDAVDDLLLSCAPQARVVRRWLDRWELRGDDLVASVSVSDGVVTPAMVERECGEGGPARPRQVELRWRATPGGFQPTPATAAELRRLDAWQKNR